MGNRRGGVGCRMREERDEEQKERDGEQKKREERNGEQKEERDAEQKGRQERDWGIEKEGGKEWRIEGEEWDAEYEGGRRGIGEQKRREERNGEQKEERDGKQIEGAGRVEVRSQVRKPNHAHYIQRTSLSCRDTGTHTSCLKAFQQTFLRMIANERRRLLVLSSLIISVTYIIYVTMLAAFQYLYTSLIRLSQPLENAG